MNQKYGVTELVLSFIILVAVSVASVTVYINHYNHSHEGFALKAEFDSVEGLTQGSPVKINGVVAGSITSITIDPQTFAAIVTFSIKNELRLPKDTTASVVSEGLLGGKVMALIPGSDEAFLSAGETIYRTQSSMNLEDLIQKFLFSGGGESKSNERRDHDKEEGHTKEEETSKNDDSRGESQLNHAGTSAWRYE